MDFTDLKFSFTGKYPVALGDTIPATSPSGSYFLKVVKVLERGLTFQDLIVTIEGDEYVASINDQYTGVIK